MAHLALCLDFNIRIIATSVIRKSLPIAFYIYASAVDINLPTRTIRRTTTTIKTTS